jgi:hypothetical protein
MRSNQPTLFDLDEPKAVRAPRKPRRRFLMHVIDAGPDDCVNEGGPYKIRYGCERCGYEGEWVNRKNVTDALRNRPACPVCNGAEKGAST